MMDQQKATELISSLIEEAEAVRRNRNLLDAWRRKGRTVLDRIFGEESKQARDFMAVSFRFHGMRALGDNMPLVRAFNNGIDRSKEVLKSCIWEIEELGFRRAAAEAGAGNAVETLRKLFTRFHTVARQLRKRHEDRPTLKIDDEYDVQDLLHALLRLSFDDVRAEEGTPSHAGKSGRVDFLLKDEQVIIEVKKTRNRLGAKEVGDQLIVDIARYQSHPDCRTLICFVYDPEGRIANPRGIEKDLARESEGLNLIVVVCPH